MCYVPTLTVFSSPKTIYKPIQNSTVDYYVSSGALRSSLWDGMRPAEDSLGDKPVKDKGEGSRDGDEGTQIVVEVRCP